MSDPVSNIDVHGAVEELGHGAYLLDVREDDEWSAGRVAAATHIRLSELPDRFNELPRDRTILCICRAGGRSAKAAAFLLEQGFAPRNVEGGMQSWALSQYPLTGDTEEPRII